MATFMAAAAATFTLLVGSLRPPWPPRRSRRGVRLFACCDSVTLAAVCADEFPRLHCMDPHLSIDSFPPLCKPPSFLRIPGSNCTPRQSCGPIQRRSLASRFAAAGCFGSGPHQRIFGSWRRARWIPYRSGASYHLGIDGLSMLLVMLTTLLGFLSILSSWSAITDRLKEYYAFFLLLQVGMLGVFMSLDFLLFFVFWETVLVPMYFIIRCLGRLLPSFPRIPRSSS